MADHKDQRSDPPAEDEDPKFTPLTRTTIAEKSLPGSNKPHESESGSDPYSSYSDNSDDEDMGDEFTEEIKKQELDHLKRSAFFSVLLAFRAETLSLGNKRETIIEKLMNEWSIGKKTLVSFDNNIQKNLVAHPPRVDSDVEMVEATPVTISLPDKKPTLFSSSVATPSSSWDRVNPFALLGRRVLVRMPGEDEFEELMIKEFNVKDGKHRLATVDLNVEWMDETLSWMDVRKIPTEDIKWGSGEDPNLETPPGFGAGQ